MDILNLLIGLFMIGIGFLLKAVPNLISGYNTLPKENKKNVDIKGLSTFLRNAFITIGLLIIIGYFFFKWIGLPLIASSMMLIVILPGIAIMVIKAQRFDHNEVKKSKLIYFILGLVFAFIIGLFIYGSIPSKMVLQNDTIGFTGMYSIEIPINEIENVILTDNLPTITMRTNGFSLGTIKKGYFNTDEFGNIHLLLQSNNPPFLNISKNNGKKTIVNFSNKEETEKIYSTIQKTINK